jgi:hypothetical protein
VWSRHLPPYYSNLRPLAFFRGSVYECDFLAEVESAEQDSVSGCHGDSMTLQGDWGKAIGMSELSRTTRRERERLRCCLWIIDSFNLDERCVWVCVSLSPLVREMLSSVIEPVSVRRFREFLARCSLLASDIYFDGVIANTTRECLLDVYYRQEESVMASQNACRNNQRFARVGWICLHLWPDSGILADTATS